MALVRGFDVLLKRFLRYTLFGAAGAEFFMSHVVDITPIDGKSMNPTLSPDIHDTGRRDWIVWRMWQPLKDLRHGDLVLFRCPSRPENVVVKRVIAQGGDFVILNPKRQPGYGKTIWELRAQERAAAERWDSYDGSLEVPYGHVWVEGDNWRNTTDSNDYGPVSKSLIIGRAWTGVWPPRISFKQPWDGYKSKTKVVRCTEVAPEDT